MQEANVHGHPAGLDWDMARHHGGFFFFLLFSFAFFGLHLPYGMDYL
jgi:hypothetical protein